MWACGVGRQSQTLGADDGTLGQIWARSPPAGHTCIRSYKGHEVVTGFMVCVGVNLGDGWV